MSSTSILDINFLCSLIRNYIVFLKTKKKQTQIVLNFFNFKQPCLQTTKNCEELRQKYIKLIDNYKALNICTSCNLLFIKKIIIKELLDSQIH